VKRITLICALALTAPSFAQETPFKAYQLLVSCASKFAKTHSSPRLTASELAAAAVVSCEAYANSMRELAYREGMSAVARLPPEEREALGGEAQRMVRANAEKIRATGIANAQKAVLLAIAKQ
jgi:hypothetical protein